ncbi:MAG: hypothetical protein U0414_33630 [Polyangiaceae bacterium]
MPSRYGFVVAQSQDSHIVASLNDIPLRDTIMPVDRYKSSTVPPDHWLMPGPNVMTLEVVRGVVGPETAINANLWDGDTKEHLAEIHWPKDFSSEPAELAHGGRPITASVAKAFVLPDSHPRPFYADAPVRDVPLRGDPQTWAPIRAFHDAFTRGDKAGVLEGLSLRLEVWARAYQSKNADPGAVAAELDRNVPAPFKMLPLDPDATVFEPIAGGKMLRVRRLDRLPVIAGKCVDEDTTPADLGEPRGPQPAKLETPFLVFLDNRYRIVF